MRRSILFVGTILGSHPNRIPSPVEELVPRLQAIGYSCHMTSHIENPYSRLVDKVITMIRLQRTYDIACIQVYGGRSFMIDMVCGRIAKLLKKKAVFVFHGGAIPETIDTHPHWFLRLIRHADLLITPSNYLADAITRYGGSVFVIPNGINIKSYHFRLRSNPKPNLCWMRAIHSVYNPIDAVHALAVLIRKYPEARLIFIGPDKGDGTLSTIQSVAQKYGIEEYIQFTGAVQKKDIPDWLNTCDIFLNTTSYESFGISVMEAAASGMCIVTTNVGELPYLWADRENALLVDPKKPEQIVTAVDQILCDGYLAEKMSKQARVQSEKYDWSKVLPQWISAFNNL